MPALTALLAPKGPQTIGEQRAVLKMISEQYRLRLHVRGE